MRSAMRESSAIVASSDCRLMSTERPTSSTRASGGPRKSMIGAAIPLSRSRLMFSKRDSAMPTTPPRSMARATCGMPQVPLVTPNTLIPEAAQRVTTARALRSIRPRSIETSGPDIANSPTGLAGHSGAKDQTPHGSALPSSKKTVEDRQHYIKMSGSELFKHAVKIMADAGDKAASMVNYRCDDIDWVIPHQANIRILNAVADRMKLNSRKIYLNIRRYGNMSSASSAVALYEAMQPSFVEYQKKILENARALATALQEQGLRLVSGGTDNHLILVDLTDSGVTGSKAAKALDTAGIVCNKNEIPFDTRPPAVTSGVRFGTPAATTRGFGTEEMKQIGSLIVKVINNVDDAKIIEQIRQEVAQICHRFPVPGIDD